MFIYYYLNYEDSVYTTKNPNVSDCLELRILHGLKSILEQLNNILKKHLYGDLAKLKKNNYTVSFTLLNDKFEDTLIRDDLKDIDFVIYGGGRAYEEEYYIEDYDRLADNSWILDGHDVLWKNKKMRNTKVIYYRQST